MANIPKSTPSKTSKSKEIEPKPLTPVSVGQGQAPIAKQASLAPIQTSQTKLTARPVTQGEVTQAKVKKPKETKELREAYTKAIALIKKNNASDLGEKFDFEKTLQALATRSPADQEKFIKGINEKYPEGWGEWAFKGLTSRIVSLYTIVPKDIQSQIEGAQFQVETVQSQIPEFASVLGSIPASILAQAREVVLATAEATPSLPASGDRIIRDIGDKVKEASISVIKTPTFKDLMYLMLLPPHPVEGYDEATKKDAQAMVGNIEHFIEKTSEDIAGVYSLQERKLEVLTDKMGQKFNETVLKSISTSAVAITNFIVKTVMDATKKTFTSEFAITLIQKMMVGTILMEEFGSKEMPGQLPGGNLIAFGLPKNVEHTPSTIGAPYIEPGMLRPMQIKIIAFCIMALIKGQKPLFYPTSVFLLLQGPFSFVMKRGKKYIKALTSILTARQDLFGISFRLLAGELLKFTVLTPLAKKSFEGGLKKLGEAFSWQKERPTVKEICSALIDSPEILEKLDPEDLEEFISQMKQLPVQEKVNVLVQLSSEQRQKLPKDIQAVLKGFEEQELLAQIEQLPLKEKIDLLVQLSPGQRQKLPKAIQVVLTGFEEQELLAQIEQLPKNEQERLFLRLSPERMKKLPEDIQTQLFDLSITLIRMPVTELHKFFGKDLEALSKEEKKALFNELRELSLEKKEALKQKLYPICMGLSEEVQSQLYGALGFNLIEIVENMELPKDRTSAPVEVGDFLEVLLKNKEVQKNFKARVSKLTEGETCDLLEKFNYISNLSQGTRTKLVFPLVQHLRTIRKSWAHYLGSYFKL